MAPVARPFEDRFFAEPPAATNAQEAATRIYNRDGILVRSDPYKAAADRNGGQFPATRWHVPKTMPPPAARSAPVAAASAAPQDPLEKFRAKILARGGAAGLQALGRTFRIMNAERDQKLTADELKMGLERFGLPMPISEVQELVVMLDRDNSGGISYDEFIVGVRGHINQRRSKMINMAYDVLDKTGDGIVTIEDIKACYSIYHDPDVLADRLSDQQALENFLGMFDCLERDGIATREEFKEYYKNVSASIEDDDYFELMIRNAWHIPGGEGWCENTANTRLLVVFADGKQKVVCVDNDLGLDFKDREAVLAALRQQGLTDVVKFSLGGEV